MAKSAAAAGGAATVIARPRRTKGDMQQAFLRIREELAASADGNTKIEEAAKLREAEVREAIEGLSVEGVAQNVLALSVQVSKALAAVSDDLVAELQRLAMVREAVALESAELERLHKIDVLATALDQLVQDYDSKQQTLESAMSFQRVAWDAEVRARERAEKEYDENLKRLRQRETEEFEYKKTLERKKSQDRYEDELRTLEKKNREKQEALEKNWQQRDAALKDREEDLARLRQEVAGFPARLQTEVERARSEAIRQTEQRFEQQLAMITKEREADRRVFELQIKALEDGIGNQAAQVAALQKQLDEAKQQVHEIAVKAIEGASGARELAHVNQIAIEQAKNRAVQE